MKFPLALTGILLGAGITFGAKPIDFFMPMPELVQLNNPALMSLRNDSSLCRLRIGVDYRHGSEMPLYFDPDNGEQFGYFDAEAYMHSGASTVWGKAYYHNGCQKNVRLCETSDYDMVYPYVQADAVGGNMRLERYAFSGGWSGTLRRWSAGVSFSYLAGLYYRRVDPRPRNVTGDMSVHVGLAYSLSGSYSIAAHALFQRYTQSSDISFVSEMGVSNIYNLTGLGTHYTRFDGSATKTDYKGYVLGGGLSLASKKANAFFASVQYSRYSLDKHITNINNLPMARIGENRIEVETGCKFSKSGSNLSLKVFCNIADRKGYENIFGDPVGSSYPVIGDIQPYRNIVAECGLKALCRTSFQSWDCYGEVGFSNENYDEKMTDATSSRHLNYDRLQFRINLGAGKDFGKRFNLLFNFNGCCLVPLDSSFSIPEGTEVIDIMLRQQQLYYFHSAASCIYIISPGISAAYKINSKYSMGILLEWCHLQSSNKNKSDFLGSSLNFYF